MHRISGGPSTNDGCLPAKCGADTGVYPAGEVALLLP